MALIIKCKPHRGVSSKQSIITYVSKAPWSKSIKSDGDFWGKMKNKNEKNRKLEKKGGDWFGICGVNR